MHKTPSLWRWVVAVAVLSAIAVALLVTNTRRRAFENGNLAEFPVRYRIGSQWETRVVKGNFVSVQAPDCDDSTKIARFQNKFGADQDVFFILNDDAKTRIEAQEILIPTQRVEWRFRFDRSLTMMDFPSPFADAVLFHPQIRFFRMEHFVTFSMPSGGAYEYGAIYYDRKSGFYQYCQLGKKGAEVGSFAKVTPQALLAMGKDAQTQAMDQNPKILKKFGAHPAPPRPELTNTYDKP